METIDLENANSLSGSRNEDIAEVTDAREIASVVNDAARRYQGVIPEDCYHEPYMPVGEVLSEMKRMRFYGLRKDMRLLGVMGKERIRDVTLIRHAYVLTGHQGEGIGSRLLTFLEGTIDTEWLLIGTWQAATWAIDFYLKHGFEMMPHKDDLLRRYWDIPDRQIATSCVLGKRFLSPGD
jgi:GNAT superfamily N-acetyltransferase